MIFKNFLYECLDAFVEAFLVVGGGGYEGDLENVFYLLIGFPLFICFVVGVCEIIRIISLIIYDLESKCKWRKK